MSSVQELYSRLEHRLQPITVDRHEDFIAFVDGQPVGVYDEDNEHIFHMLVISNNGAKASTLARRMMYNNRKARSAGRRLTCRAKQWISMHRFLVRWLGPQNNPKLYQWRRMGLCEKVFGSGTVESTSAVLTGLLL